MNRLETARQSLLELPDAKMARFQADYGLSEEDSAILTTMRETADYLDEAVKAGADAKTAANWMLGDLSKMVNEANITFADDES